MSNFSLDHVNDMYMDVLKEIGNIGAGNATTSLASMLNEQINMNVPKVELMEASKLGSAICPEDEIIVGIFLEVSNDITGSMMFLMKMDSAHYLVNKLMGKDPDNQEPFDEMDLSAMKEIGNIIAGSYLSALSGMTNMTIASRRSTASKSTATAARWVNNTPRIITSTMNCLINLHSQK